MYQESKRAKKDVGIGDVQNKELSENRVDVEGKSGWLQRSSSKDVLVKKNKKSTLGKVNKFKKKKDVRHIEEAQKEVKCLGRKPLKRSIRKKKENQWSKRIMLHEIATAKPRKLA